MTEKMARNVLKSSLHDAGFSIVFQVFCRTLTFIINAFIVHNVGREVLGIMNVRLLLLESTILFLSREAINRAALGATLQTREQKCTWAQLINQQWLTVIICSMVSLPCGYIWLYCLSPVNSIYLNQYRFACYAIIVSCIIEFCAEAPVFVSQVFCFVRLKIVLNTVHITVRSALFLTIVIYYNSLAIYAFAISQLASAITIVISHYAFFIYYIGRFNTLKKAQLEKQMVEENDEGKESRIVQKKEEKGDGIVKNFCSTWDNILLENMDDFPLTHVTEFFPGVMANEGDFFNTELQILTWSFVKQTILKLILTEGEKYVMSMTNILNFEEQATCDVVNNLGSLAARFIFRPIEESSTFYFTQTISRTIPIAKQNHIIVQQASQVLGHLSMFVVSIGLVALIFGQSYAYTILYLYGGVDFVSDGLAEVLLKWHCLAICFLAVNGITEGYMFATNTSRDIDKYNYLLAIFSLIFLLLSYLLTRIFGPVGFIFANCINMLCRICYSIRYIYLQYKPLELNPTLDLIPNKKFLVSVIFAGLICKYSQFYTSSMIHHMIVGFVCLVFVGVIWLIENKELIKVCWMQRDRFKKTN